MCFCFLLLSSSSLVLLVLSILLLDADLGMGTQWDGCACRRECGWSASAGGQADGAMVKTSVTMTGGGGMMIHRDS